MADVSWLVARPIAHRGLHDVRAARFENTRSAALAAISAGFAIECDVQRTADDEAVVFHDFTLDRLTGGQGALAAQTAAALGRLTVGTSPDAISSLPAFLDVIAGRVPVICEIKSAFDDDLRLASRVAEIARAYSGRLAVKSFDPAVITYLRGLPLPDAVPLGIVAEATYDDPEWDHLTPTAKRDLAALAHFPQTRPDFLSYHVTDLPHAAATLFRHALGRPVMAWTVRTREQQERAARSADQIVFEGLEV